MRRLIGCLLAVSFLGSACALTPTATKRSVTTRGAGTVKPATSAKPGVTSPRPGASAKPTLLEGPTVLVKGKVAIDAHYLLSNNAGTLISNNGGGAIALKGGSLISDNGLGLISDNGLGLISDNGLGLIANNGAGYRVLQAGTVALGTILPVKGMAVIPVSMRTGEIVGKPVLTDAAGTYALEVPEAVQGNIRLVARVPVSSKDDPIARDPRAQYNLLVAAKAKDPVIDEDTSITTRYMRACFAGRLKDILRSSDADATSTELVKSLGFAPGIKTFLSATVVEINLAAKAAKVDGLNAAELDELAQRMTDVLLSYMDVETLVIDPAKYGKPGDPEPALPGMADVISKLRDAATQKMASDPNYFNEQAWIKDKNWTRQIEKPADFCDFVVDNYLLSIDGRLSLTKTAFINVGVSPDEAERLNAIAIGVLAQIGQTLLMVPESKAQVLAIVKASGER